VLQSDLGTEVPRATLPASSGQERIGGRIRAQGRTEETSSSSSSSSLSPAGGDVFAAAGGLKGCWIALRLPVGWGGEAPLYRIEVVRAMVCGAGGGAEVA
jgi:hypothetical protein